VGGIPAQIDFAFARLGLRRGDAGEPAGSGEAAPPARWVKLYNAGSFFDPGAIPPADYGAIADRVRGFQRVIVECHPALVGARCLRFRDLLGAAGPRHRSGAARGVPPAATDSRLEVALGLETAHPDTLAKLNKRMTLDQFRRAAEFLRREGIALRVFVLVQPPFLSVAEAPVWARRSVDVAFDCGATAVSLILTRAGNGAMEALAASGGFSSAGLAALEAAVEYGVSLGRGRVFADLWEVERFSDCPLCFPKRVARLREMNRGQTVPSSVSCKACGAPSGSQRLLLSSDAPRF
jgi:archaeosine synthase beta-subunit